MPTPYESLARTLEQQARTIRAMGERYTAATAALPIPAPLVPMEQVERSQTEATLKASRSITEAARSLGISRRTLHRHINQWGLPTPRTRHRAALVTT